ncbi:MAG: glycosyltransferase involved in cell wall biosynthesis [Bacteroidia bacterium]|jgi:glycosyltransferase involved in cell wall biosynthesis
MKIGFDAKRYFNNQTGLGNYARWLVNNLALNQSNEYVLYQPKLVETTQTNIKYPAGIFSLLTSLWRSRFICRDLVRDKIEVYHGLSNELPFGIHKTNIKTVVTIHDLINKRYPHYYSKIDGYIYDRKLRYTQRVATQIVVPSKQTKDDLISFYNTDSDKVIIIPLSLKAKDLGHETLNMDKPYVLCVSGFSKRKNLLNLVQAYQSANLELNLVIAGRKGDSYAQIEHLAKNDDRVLLYPNVTDKTLSSLYQGAIFCVYPSEFEGFGIPILEAFSYGKTVATSNCSSMPEVGGDAAEYFDPLIQESIKHALEHLSVDSYRQQREAKISKQLSLFQSDILVGQYLNLYQSI